MKLYKVKIVIFENRVKLLGDGFKKRVEDPNYDNVTKCLGIDDEINYVTTQTVFR